MKELRILFFFFINVTSEPFLDDLTALSNVMFKSISKQSTSGDNLWAKCNTYELDFLKEPDKNLLLFPQGEAPGSVTTLTTNSMKKGASPYSVADDSMFT